MPARFVAALAVLVAGCAASAPPPVPDGASVDLSTAPLAGYALPPVEAPRLPAALRTSPTPATQHAGGHGAAHDEPGAVMDHASMDHASMKHTSTDHAAMDHAATGHAPPATALRPDALGPALDAYLALHAALVADRFADGDAAAAELAAALVQAGVGAELQAHAVAADAAADLGALRAAFGELSPHLTALVEEVGAPPGVELTAFRCGMANAPQRGVWLQATGDLANPYHGEAMRTCGRQTGTLGATPQGHGAMDHEATDHEAMDHDGHDHE